jgi:two-component system phosphate regulon sensor histidine kinase PhoR
MFKSLRGKLVITFLVLIFTAMLMVGAFLLGSLEKYYLNSIANNLRKEAELLTAVLPENSLSGELVDQLTGISRLWAKKLNNRVTIIGLDGNVLGDSHEPAQQMENHREREEVVDALDSGYGQSVRYSATLNKQMLYVAVPIFDSAGFALGVARMAVPLNNVQEDLSRLWSILVSVILLSSIITAVLGIKLSTGIIKPLEEMTGMAEEISRGNFDQSLPIHTGDEVGKLGMALQKMADDLKEKMSELLDEKSKFETVLENVLSGITLLDQDKRIVLVNPAAGRIFGFKPEEVLGKPITVFTHNYQLGLWVAEVEREGNPIKQELTIYSPRERFLEVNLLPLTLSSGQFAGVLAVFYDLTEIRRLERVRQDFVANVSHELRTPLTAIKGLSETLLDGAIEDEQVREEFVRTILKESDRLNRLVGDLLTLSRIESGKREKIRESFDLALTVNQTVKELSYYFNRLNVKVKIVLPRKPVYFRGNEDELKQVLLNLLENAAKYSGPGGLIELIVEEKGDLLEISVKDEGIGIPPEDLPRIFERFYRVDKARSRKLGGTGLGLSIVKHIVESYGGIIRVESCPGEGSRFLITLPRD